MKRAVLLIGILLVVGGGYMFYQKNQSVEPNNAPAPSAGKTYTLEEVAKHTQKDDCWLAIEGKVYDVTSFVKGGLHPGKDAILQGCGKDATEMFNSRPNDGTAHSSRARDMLPKYYIGELAK